MNRDKGISRVEGIPQGNAFFALRPYLTVKQAAEYLRVHPRTIYEWVSLGEVAFVDLNANKKGKTNKCLRFYADDLDRFMMVRRTGAVWEQQLEAV